MNTVRTGITTLYAEKLSEAVCTIFLCNLYDILSDNISKWNNILLNILYNSTNIYYRNKTILQLLV